MVIHGRDGDLNAYLLADDLPPHAARGQRNEMLRALDSVVEEVLSGHPPRDDAVPANPEAIALHDEVARAVRLGDGPAAERAMRAIIEEAATALSEENTA